MYVILSCFPIIYFSANINISKGKITKYLGARMDESKSISNLTNKNNNPYLIPVFGKQNENYYLYLWLF